MALDGLVVNSIAHELNSKLVGGKIDRVHQPENDEILLYVRNNRENFKVVLSSSSSNPRVYIANKYNKENPLKAPMFCMLLRKHLQGGIITDITQVGFERIIKISIESYDELKDNVDMRSNLDSRINGNTRIELYKQIILKNKNNIKKVCGDTLLEKYPNINNIIS